MIAVELPGGSRYEAEQTFVRVGRTDAEGETVWSTYFRGSPVYRDMKPLIEAAAKLAARCAAEEMTRERSQDG